MYIYTYNILCEKLKGRDTRVQTRTKVVTGNEFIHFSLHAINFNRIVDTTQ